MTPHGVGRCPKGRGDRSVRGGPPLGGGEVLSCNLLCNVLECILFDICGDPSVSAAHCQLPFQGSLIFLIFSSWKVPFATSHWDLAKILLFLSGFTRGAVLFAPRKKLPLFVPFSVRQKHGRREFRRLRTATQEAPRLLRPSRQLRSVGSAFSGTRMRCVFVPARWVLCSV